MPWAIDRVGPERIQWAYAWRSLIDAGSFIPAGSDAPVEDPDVLSGIYAAVTRKRIDGTPEEGWNTKECMTREEGLKAFTLWGAMAAFQERSLGSITPGKYADFVLLDDDPLTCDPRKIPGIRVEMTVVGGRQVFPNPGH
jgi:predicted amidohydrolase YtcJ